MRSSLGAGILAVYLVVLFDLTLLRFPQGSPRPNPVPMRTIAACWESGGRSMVVNVLGNLALLAPIGMILPMGWPRSARPGHVLSASILLSGTIEAAQFAGGRRTADVDDLILNVLGAMIAFAGIRAIVALAPLHGGRPEGQSALDDSGAGRTQCEASGRRCWQGNSMIRWTRSSCGIGTGPGTSARTSTRREKGRSRSVGIS